MNKIHGCLIASNSIEVIVPTEEYLIKQKKKNIFTK